MPITNWARCQSNFYRKLSGGGEKRGQCEEVQLFPPLWLVFHRLHLPSYSFLISSWRWPSPQQQCQQPCPQNIRNGVPPLFSRSCHFLSSISTSFFTSRRISPISRTCVFVIGFWRTCDWVHATMIATQFSSNELELDCSAHGLEILTRDLFQSWMATWSCIIGHFLRRLENAGCSWTSESKSENELVRITFCFLFSCSQK